MPTYTMADLTPYGRDSPLLLVDPVLEHLLDLLTRRLVLVLFFLRVFDREPGLSILYGNAILVLNNCNGCSGGRHEPRTIVTIDVAVERNDIKRL